LVGKREADKALTAFVAEVGEGTVVRPRAGRTFGELLEAWFEARSGDWSPSTAYQTRWMIDHRALGLAGRSLKSIDVATLDRFYAELRKRGGKDGALLSVASVQRVHAMVRLALEQAVKWGWRSDNPAVHARPGKTVPVRFTPPTADEVIQLLEAAEESDPEFLVFLFLDAETGARRGEVSALRFSDFGDGVVRIARTLVIGLDAEEARLRYEGHIWPRGWGRGAHATAVIEKDSPKNERSIRTVALTEATAKLVDEHRARLVERAACRR
jgi:integrase